MLIDGVDVHVRCLLIQGQLWTIRGMCLFVLVGINNHYSLIYIYIKQVFNLDDVDTAFDHFTQLKYSQHVTLPGETNSHYLFLVSFLRSSSSLHCYVLSWLKPLCFFCSNIIGGLTITPFPAGRMIGGTVWKIQKETEEIVYAIDYNHKKEK